MKGAIEEMRRLLVAVLIVVVVAIYGVVWHLYSQNATRDESIRPTVPISAVASAAPKQAVGRVVDPSGATERDLNRFGMTLNSSFKISAVKSNQ